MRTGTNQNREQKGENELDLILPNSDHPPSSPIRDRTPFVGRRMLNIQRAKFRAGS
jgi:hypothetical protein